MNKGKYFAIGPLRAEILERSPSSSSDDYWDSNWLTVAVKCESSDGLRVVSGSILHLTDLKNWTHKLRSLIVPPKPPSLDITLTCMEPTLEIKLSVSETDKVAGFVQLDDGSSSPHKVEFECEKKELKILCDELSEILSAYPILGKQSLGSSKFLSR